MGTHRRTADRREEPETLRQAQSRPATRPAGDLRVPQVLRSTRRGTPRRVRPLPPGRRIAGGRRRPLLVADSSLHHKHHPEPLRKEETVSRPAKGRTLFYHRDSEGHSELAPGQYVIWTAREARERGLSFTGTPDAIGQMIRRHEWHRGDLFLDYGISGNELERPGLKALRREVARDRNVSHIFIHHRARLARPDDPLDGWKLEMEFRIQ